MADKCSWCGSEKIRMRAAGRAACILHLKELTDWYAEHIREAREAKKDNGRDER